MKRKMWNSVLAMVQSIGAPGTTLAALCKTTEIVKMRQKDAKTASEEETPRISPS